MDGPGGEVWKSLQKSVQKVSILTEDDPSKGPELQRFNVMRKREFDEITEEDSEKSMAIISERRSKLEL